MQFGPADTLFTWGAMHPAPPQNPFTALADEQPRPTERPPKACGANYYGAAHDPPTTDGSREGRAVNADDVVWELTRRAWRFGVSVLLSPEKTVDSGDGFGCGGFFCDQTRRLAVATGRSEDAWLGVLIHEYSHLTQWVEGAPVWNQVKEGMWDWINGKTIHNPREAVRTVQELEADCERRTIRTIRELNAPVDLDRYTRTANAYIHFHNTIAEKRKWYRKDVVMSQIDSLRAAANPTFDTDFRKTPPALRRELEALL